MTDLLPCPMCGTAAHFFKIDDVDQKDFGGQGICCQTEGCVQIGLMFACMDDPKPSLAEKWNRRAPTQGADARPATSDEDAYVIKRLSSVLAEVAAALFGEEADGSASELLGKLPERAQTLMVEVELYRSNAEVGVVLNITPDRVRLPAIGDELYEHYPAMSAQSHEAAVKAYARAALATSDAAPRAAEIDAKRLQRWKPKGLGGQSRMLSDNKGKYVKYSDILALIAATAPREKT